MKCGYDEQRKELEELKHNFPEMFEDKAMTDTPDLSRELALAEQLRLLKFPVTVQAAATIESLCEWLRKVDEQLTGNGVALHMLSRESAIARIRAAREQIRRK